MVARSVLFDQPINQTVHLAPVCGVVKKVLEVLVLLEHGRFIDVIIRGNAVVMGVFRKLTYIARVVVADVGIEKDLLLAQNVFKVFLCREPMPLEDQV